MLFAFSFSSFADDVVHNFTESGTSSDFFDISGNLSTSKGTVTYDGLTLTQCLKIESSTSITFTTTAEATITLVFNDDFEDGIYIDETSYTASSGIVTATLDAGSHSITKDDVANLYYISLVYTSSSDDDEGTITLTATAGDGQVVLSWSSTDISSSYQVYRDTDSDADGRVRITTVANSVTTYTDTDVTNGTTYYYWIKATDDSDNTINSDAASATPSEDAEETGTITLSASAGAGQVVLSWSSTDISSNYQVYRDTDSDADGRVRITTVANSVTTYTDSDVTAGTTYYYWIKATDDYDNTVNSNSASATPTEGDDDDDDVDFSMVGFATEDGGTTGGSGGTTVYASTGDEILEYIDAKQDGDYSDGLIIMVNGTITSDNTDDTKIAIKDVEDVSLIGVGTSGEFDGIGIKVYKASNVIIRNVYVHHVLIGDKDAISIEGPVDHVWVDHCELEAEYDDVDKDYYDGLLDAKKASYYITYSWNYLHDSWKTMLCGSSDSDDYDRTITAHHNIFENCNSRMPLFRFGTGHFFNNYYIDGASTAINSRMGACIRIEKNYFENTQNPYVSAYSDEDGSGELIDNYLDNCTWDLSDDDVNEIGTCEATIPYDYDDVLNSVSTVPSITQSYAGVGVISDPASFTVKSTEGTLSYQEVQSINSLEAYPNPFNNETIIRFNLEANQQVTMNLYDCTGRLVDQVANSTYLAGTNEIKYENHSLSSGMYILSVQTNNTIKNIQLVVR